MSGAATLRGNDMTTILVDADIVAYKVACVNQEEFDWGDTGSSTFLNHEEAKRQTDDLIAKYCEATKAHHVIVCLTDPVNFRKQLNPTYKHNRKDKVPPALLAWTKEYLADEYRSFIRPRLEADDVMGILATSGDRFVKGKRIIVSEDKDMRTIPCLLYNPNHPDQGVQRINKLDSKRFLMWQVICGDQTDGYPGCPGIGPESVWAEDILGATLAELWDTVLMAYASKGLTETDAILQARMARILQDGDYNYKTKGIRLWNPTCLRW